VTIYTGLKQVKMTFISVENLFSMIEIPGVSKVKTSFEERGKKK